MSSASESHGNQVAHSKIKRLIIAGGGTGGHVLAGIAVADEWKKRFGEGSVFFVGAKGGIEEKLVPRAGYSLRLLVLGSLKRVSLSTRLKTLFQLPFALVRSKIWLLQERPHAVLGVGGYASGPLILMGRLAGWIWGVRVGILEQNAVPGFTNRILSRFSHTIFTAFPGLEKQFPGAHLIVSGNPVRDAIQYQPRDESQPPTIFIFGGSQGAQAINTWVIESLPLLAKELPHLYVIHQTGERDFERVHKAYQSSGLKYFRVEKFIYDMPECYKKASLIICRAGSGTLSEVAAVGRPAILIPFPFAADNHQEKNAYIFKKANAAEVLTQGEGSSAILAGRVLSLLTTERSELEKMGQNAHLLHRSDCAATIVDELSR